MEEARAQTLKDDLQWPLRPVWTSLNGDQSWLFSIPRPVDDVCPRRYYHIVFEPWLDGPTSEFSQWLVWISLSAPAAVSDAQAVEGVAWQIEEAAAALARDNGAPAKVKPVESGDDAYQGPLDCILLFFHYLDHVNEPTLERFDSRIPIVCTSEARDKVVKMKHFDSISIIQQRSDRIDAWRDEAMHPDCFPSWLTAVKLLGQHELNFVGALIWTHIDESGDEIHEAVLESPHGMHMGQPSLEGFLASKPPVRNLAYMHGLKESWTLNWQTTLGAEGGLKLFRRVGGAKYWIPTHHSKLQYKGLVTGWMVTDIFRKLEWALGREQTEKEGEELSAPNMTVVENGGCVVLA